MKKFISARFKSKCKETGKTIFTGEIMLYNFSTKECFSFDSKTAKQERENRLTAQYIEANENAFFDNFCQRNNI